MTAHCMHGEGYLFRDPNGWVQLLVLYELCANPCVHSLLHWSSGLMKTPPSQNRSCLSNLSIRDSVSCVLTIDLRRPKMFGGCQIWRFRVSLIRCHFMYFRVQILGFIISFRFRFSLASYSPSLWLNLISSQKHCTEVVCHEQYFWRCLWVIVDIWCCTEPWCAVVEFDECLCKREPAPSGCP